MHWDRFAGTECEKPLNNIANEIQSPFLPNQVRISAFSMATIDASGNNKRKSKYAMNEEAGGTSSQINKRIDGTICIPHTRFNSADRMVDLNIYWILVWRLGANTFRIREQEWNNRSSAHNQPTMEHNCFYWKSMRCRDRCIGDTLVIV